MTASSLEPHTPTFALRFHRQCCIIATDQNDRWRSMAYAESENIGADVEYRRAYQIRLGHKKTAVDDSTTVEVKRALREKTLSPEKEGVKGFYSRPPRLGLATLQEGSRQAPQHRGTPFNAHLLKIFRWGSPFHIVIICKNVLECKYFFQIAEIF